MASIEPYKFRERTNLQEHNDIVTKVNEIVDVINDTDLDNINTRLTNDESQIADNTAGIKTNTSAIDALSDAVDTIDKSLDTIEPMVNNHETDITNLKESERRLSNDVVSTYTLYRNGEGKIKAQMETVGGTLIDSNTLDMIIPYQYDIISGTTDRSFKLKITMSDGSSYTTNDFIIPEGGGSEIVVTGITLSKDSSNVNRFHVGINLSDSTMIDSGYITMVDNVSASFSDSKLTISVNGVSSVPVAIDVSGEFTAGTGITITSGTIAIDDTVVALKSDIADMETKTNASATYATKTALALTDSVANDANNKANSAIDNVSISGSTLTFTKINDEHIDVNIPTSSVIDKTKAVSLGFAISGTSKTISLAQARYSLSVVNPNVLMSVGDNIVCVKTRVLNWKSSSSTSYSTYQYSMGSSSDYSFYTQRNVIIAKLLENIDLNKVENGEYIVQFAVPDVIGDLFGYCVTISDGEITNVEVLSSDYYAATSSITKLVLISFNLTSFS